MNNAALAKALEASQPFDLDCSPPSRVAAQTPHSTPATHVLAQDLRPGLRRGPDHAPPRAAARSVLNKLWLLSAAPAPVPQAPRGVARRTLGMLLRRSASPAPVPMPPRATACGVPSVPLQRMAAAYDPLTPAPPRLVLPVPPAAAPRGIFQALWLRIFGPPAIDPSAVSREFGAFRAFCEIGSDYLPSSGTWPSPCGPQPITSDRS